jgi:hypothetical protein
LGRKSLAEEHLKKVTEVENEGESTWLVMYDFDSKPNPNFWLNLRRLVRLLGEGSMVQ